MSEEKKKKQKTGISRLMELAGAKKKQLSQACLLAALSSAARIVPFFTIYGILRELMLHYDDLSGLDIGHIYRMALFTFAAALVYGVCAFTSTVLAHKAAYNTLYEMRIQIMEKLSRIPAGFFTGNTQGGLKKVMSEDVEKIEEFIAHHITDIAAAVSLPLFTIGYLFFRDWRLAILTLLPIIISMFLLNSGLKDPKGAQAQKNMREKREQMNGTIVEYIHGMQVIKVFNRTLSAFKRYEGDINGFVEAVKDTAHLFAPRMGGYYAAFGAQLLLILPGGLYLCVRAESYAGYLPVLLLFFLVGTGLKEPLENMMLMVTSMNEISRSLERIDEILYHAEIQAPEKEMVPANYDITFEKVSFSYQDDQTRALDQVSFHLKEGAITGLVGPSGGGKSTIAQLCLRFYEPQAGNIKIGGVNIRDIAPGKLMEMIGYVFQDSILFHDTVEGNIRMGNQSVTREQVVRAAQAASIHDVIMNLPNGYDTVIGEADVYLSGGEKQRIAIARVFLKDAPIVLLDEATAYADAENESKIQEAFARLVEHKTVLIIAHRMKTIEQAHQILVLKDGSLEEMGTHEELQKGQSVYCGMIEANERRDTWAIAN